MGTIWEGTPVIAEEEAQQAAERAGLTYTRLAPPNKKEGKAELIFYLTFLAELIFFLQLFTLVPLLSCS